MLVSPRVGIIRSVVTVRRGADEPVPPVICHATLSHFDFRSAPAGERVTAGKGLTEADAERSAIAEAIERYCAAQVDPRALRRATWHDLQAAGPSPDTPAANAIAPNEFVLYSPRQYASAQPPAVPWDPGTELTWVTGRELPERREVWLPASLVYLAIAPDARERLCPPSSSGLAAGSSLEMAVLHALYELVERDAFLITWMNRLPAPEVDFSSVRGAVADIAAHYARFGGTLRVFDVTTDIPIPVMMAVVVDKSGVGPAVVVGLGCHLDPQVALTRAVLEVCQTHASEQARRRSRPPGAVDPVAYPEVENLEDHAAFAAGVAHLGEFAFLFDHGRRRVPDEMPNAATGSIESDLAHCVAVLRAAGSRVAFADLTTPDVRPLGLHVVRAVATGLQPIHFGFGQERLGGRRLYEVPRRLGHAVADRTESELNPCPHPLA
jgi:ribosomal protein S12 methylthiotransferase accessory factor